MAEENPHPGETLQRVGMGAGLAVGMGVGVALGSALDDMGLGIGIGIAIGTAMMVAFTAAGSRMRRRGGEEGPDASSGDGADGAER
ncbi:hypothetical protein [Microbacterium hydrocarbonoxydans]|uniref:hypothetical protein n=1 Tax=Microbacterium hydrocarbonoxydans TaxID=273678 RepID=UPI001AB04AB2|nr:hypothetical protein [Microbacterium hydrocarbonoxydans]